MQATLVCLVVGAWSFLSVEIELDETVDDLQDKIKESDPDLIRCGGEQLRLYLARDRDGKWLTADNDDLYVLEHRNVPAAIQELMEAGSEMDQWSNLDDDEYFGEHFAPREMQVHVLVEMPDDPQAILRYYTGWRKCVARVGRWVYPTQVGAFIVLCLLPNDTGAVARAMISCFFLANGAWAACGLADSALEMRCETRMENAYGSYRGGFPYRRIP